VGLKSKREGIACATSASPSKRNDEAAPESPGVRRPLANISISIGDALIVTS
jgi:hypothetical protein